MDNIMTMPVIIVKDGKSRKFTSRVEGRAFEFRGTVLHVRKIGSYWMISLFNSGLATRGIGRTLYDAIYAYMANEGRIIAEWMQERAIEHLYNYRTTYIKDNTVQEIDLEFNEQTCRLVTGKRQKAGDLI